MKLRFLSLLVFIVAGVSAQNDPLYNLYLFNQSMINPAYAGIYNVTNATLISRAQWTGIDGAPVTNTLSASTSFLQDKLGAGLLIVNDRLGINNNIEIQTSYAYKVKFRYSVLALGLQAGMINYRYDYNKLNLEMPDQALTQQQQPNFTKPTVGMGIFYKAEKYYVGLSVPRLLNIAVDDSVASGTRYKRHVYLSGGFIIDRFQLIKIKPSVLVRYVDHGSVSVDLNGSVLFSKVLWCGVSVRNFNAFGANVQLEVNTKFKFGYAYELPTNTLAGSAHGTHEFMLSVDLELLKGQLALNRYF